MMDCKNKLFLPSDFNCIEFTNKIHPRLKVQSMYFELGFSASPKIYGRQAVLDRLITALALLPESDGFLVWDVYRPRSVQATLFNWMSEQIRKKAPHLSAAENYAETCKFAAPPSAIGEENCAPHLSGGAIDLTLFNLATGQALDMGTVFDDCSERAHRDYFDRLPTLTNHERDIQQARMVLRQAMEKSGFVSYEYEWWHFDIGDRLWAGMTGNAAEFGPLFGDAEWP